MRLTNRVDYPIKEEMVCVAYAVVHMYFFADKGWWESELAGLKPIEDGPEHLHYFITEDGLYSLRTDGRASSNPKRYEGQTTEPAREVMQVLSQYMTDYQTEELAPIMIAPMDIQLRWYEYLMNRRGEWL